MEADIILSVATTATGHRVGVFGRSNDLSNRQVGSVFWWWRSGCVFKLPGGGVTCTQDMRKCFYF